MINYNKFLKTLIFIFCICIILIPLIINFSIIHMNWIPSAGSNGEWLSFWGSAFGGSVGAISTLISVVITLKASNTSIPKLFPLRTMYYCYVSDSSIILSKDKEGYKHSPFTTIFLNLINVGLEDAINTRIEFDLNKSGEIYDITKKLGFTEEEFQNLDDCYSKTKIILEKDLVISSKTKENFIQFELDIGFILMLKHIVKKERTNLKSRSKGQFAPSIFDITDNGTFKLTTYSLKYEDIYGNKYSELFDLFVTYNHSPIEENGFYPHFIFFDSKKIK